LGRGPAISATIAQPDPLIALGEAERAAYCKFCDANLELDRAQGAFLEKHGRWPSEDHDEPGMGPSLYDARDDAEDAWEAALQEMAETSAVTLAGLVVKLRNVAEDVRDDTVSVLTKDLIASAFADAERLAARTV
jgi:hypothetical protein